VNLFKQRVPALETPHLIRFSSEMDSFSALKNVVLLISTSLALSALQPSISFAVDTQPQTEEGSTSDQKLVTPAAKDEKESGSSGSTSVSSGKASDALDGTSTGSGDKIVKLPSPGDDQRTQNILNSLADQAGWFPDVRISVKNGMVTIDGKAKNGEQLSWLAKTADRLPSVIAVINKAVIEEPPVTDLSPAWKEMRGLIEKAKRSLPLLLIAAALFTLFFLAGRYIMRGVTSLWSRKISNPFLLSTVAKVTMIPIWVLFFYMTLQTAGLSSLATTIIGGTGALGIVLGFAFKDIAENYLSGLLLAFRSPFTKGDLITVEDYEGYVQSINMRGTTILDLSGNLVLIPNSNVIQSVIKNQTATPETRLKFSVGIGYCDSYQKARDLIAGVLNDIPEILKTPAPLIGLDRLSASSADIDIMFWINIRNSSGMAVKAEAISRVKEVLLANGISLPDSSREIVFTDTLKVQTLASREEAEQVSSQKSEEAKRRAENNLNEAKKKPQSTTTQHEDQLRQLSDGVDLLNAGGDSQDNLYKKPEVAGRTHKDIH
jgi:small conductance mechanosensitive channel